MRDRDLYAAILGLTDPWKVADVDLDTIREEVRVTVVAREGTKFTCPECGKVSPRHDHRRREWRHLDTCQFRTILCADVPRVRCEEHGVHQVHVPWAEPGSGFTALFEALVIDWLREATILAVARRLHLTWDTVAGIQERAVERGLTRRKIETVEFIGVDETSFRKRRDYVTVVTDLLTGVVLDTADGHGKASLEAFYARLTAEQLAGIRAVAMDMHKPYIAATRHHVPDADSKICFDRFHVAKHLGDGVNKVRRAEHRELLAAGDPVLTGTRHTWLRRGDTLDGADREVLEVLRNSSLRTARAWAMKEFAAGLWSYVTPGWARRGWRRLIGWLQRSRLPPMQQVGKMIGRHLWGIVNAVVQGVTNAGSESVNARIQRVKKMACGFRNKKRFRNAILFHLGGLELYPATLSATHTDS
jgi:transposase